MLQEISLLQITLPLLLFMMKQFQVFPQTNFRHQTKAKKFSQLLNDFSHSTANNLLSMLLFGVVLFRKSDIKATNIQIASKKV